MFVFTANNERDTERLGAALADALPAGTVVGLIGTLGAGKTRIVQAVAAALGVPSGNVTSPTFVLVNEYRGGRLPVYHFDTYRLKDEDEFLALGPEEYFESNGLSFVEWSDRVAKLLPSERLEISIDVIGETERRITVRGTSPKMDDLVTRINAACGLA
ncbi:MAG: tRNA (adenosine(37)-N6)-threonylcarbamoyltransferase complex ATPase subunit type 1 TsaE [Planctomycetes bacterium]|nr:tRNA (adenosine(37)-N6)-threonylcarbamoyltransferase complex ATPase subunit type 1 TsaE [Planctomycetota bacterium]